MARHAMTRGELLTLLTEEAKQYCIQAMASIERNRHANDLSKKELKKLKKNQKLTQRMIDALLVDFINVVGVGQGIDYALYTKDLKETPKSPGS